MTIVGERTAPYRILCRNPIELRWFLLRVMVVVGGVLWIHGPMRAEESQPVDIPTGKTITPTAASGAIFQDLNPGHKAAPDVRAGQVAAVSVSPDGRTLAILTSGFNLFNAHWTPESRYKVALELSTEYIFLFDISGSQPRQLQVLPIHNSFQGLAWAPASNKIFVSGGIDDAVQEFIRNGSTFAAARTFALGHRTCVGHEASNLRSRCKPQSGGLALSPDGTRLLVTNLQDDSVSLVDLASGQVVAERDLRPGIIDPKYRGQPGGSFPRCVTWLSPDHAYVASERDREIISLAISGTKITVVRRMPVHGQPVALLANRSGSRLYAALDNSDQAAIFETAGDTLIETVDVAAPKGVYANTKKLAGANSNALALTPDERMLLVSNGGENAVSVIRLSDRAKDRVPNDRKDQDRDDRNNDDEKPDFDESIVVGLVPTGWYPTGVATSKDGSTWYIVNAKSPTGSNIHWCQGMDPIRKLCIAKKSGGTYISTSENGLDMLTTENQYIHQLEKAGFLALPAPSPRELARLTKQVVRNNHFDQQERTANDERLFSFLRAHIEHVIYIVKENRSYDQVLGDLDIGNGDPRLTLFPERLSPNHHAISRNFVTLDNFLVSGEVSWTGWDWSVSAQTNDFMERMEPLVMADRASLDRGINMGYATSAERRARDPRSPFDPDILPGTRDVYEVDGPGGEEGKGYLWDVALRQGLTLRNWGFFGDYLPAPLVHDAYAQKLTVSAASKASLMPYNDPYYHGWDLAFPDYWRVLEWKREFAEFSARKSAPNLMLVRLGNDHFGAFARAIDGVNTPDTQMADNDYALGLIIEAVANSPFASDTLIISIEDDACDGPDHVDAHRSVTLFAGPYVRQHALVSSRYTTVSVVKTIEEILGLGPIGLNDALAAPMSDIFDPNVTTWSYKAIVPDVLRSTELPLPPADHASIEYPRRSAAYWTDATAGQDFSGPDRIEPISFGHALWRGLKGDASYPASPTGADFADPDVRLR